MSDGTHKRYPEDWAYIELNKEPSAEQMKKYEKEDIGRTYDAETHMLIEKPQTLEEMEAMSIRYLNYMNNRTETAIKLAKKNGWKASTLSNLVRDQQFRNDIMTKLFLPLFENGISRLDPEDL